MNAFDSVQLDVTRGARPTDPRLRLGGIENSNRIGHTCHDLIDPDDGQQVVGHQGKRAATLACAVVEHDRAGERNRHGAAGDDTARGVEVGQRDFGLVEKRVVQLDDPV